MFATINTTRASLLDGSFLLCVQTFCTQKLGHPDNINMKTFLLASSALLAVCNADIKFSRTINTITDATADVTISGCAATDKYGKRPE